jgi:hypothetical protein
MVLIMSALVTIERPLRLPVCPTGAVALAMVLAR